MIKVGDKVQVTGDFYHDLNIGDVVTCVELDDDGDHKFQGPDGDAWYMEPDDYELVKDILYLEQYYRTKLADAYLAGFNASGEAWNGENMITATKDSPEQHKGWCLARETYLNGICGKLSK